MEKLVCLEDFEKHALVLWDENASGYYSSGADDEVTLKENVKAFRRINLLPRILRTDVSSLHLSTTFLGEKVAFPVGFAPTSMQGMCHPDGECATAAAASDFGVVYVQSMTSNKSIEEVKTSAPNGVKWLQIYLFKDRQVNVDLANRAFRAGFTAIVLTVDAPIGGNRRRDQRNKFKLPSNLSLANFRDYSNRMKRPKESSAIQEFVFSAFDQNITWSDVDWLKSISPLPIVLKGILHPGDAVEAARRGVAGVIVSNHGARQLDTTPASIDALPSIVDAVKGSGVEVFLDSGIKTGGDVFKSLALGAKGVFVGRPVLHGLTVGGRAGVTRVMQILRDELSRTMALMGVNSVADIGSAAVAAADAAAAAAAAFAAAPAAMKAKL